MRSNMKSRGLTIVDVLATLVALTLLLAIAIPTLGRAREDSSVAVSLSNLQQINAGAEQALSLNFSAGGQRISGYSVNIFYP